LDLAQSGSEFSAIPMNVEVIGGVVGFIYMIGSMAQEAKGKNIKLANKRLVDLMLFGLDHGIESIKIKGKGPLVPFVVTEKNGEKEVTRFFTVHLEDGLSEAVRFVKEDRKSALAVLVYDGFVPLNGKNLHAVIVRGNDRTDPFGYTLGQRYIPSGFFSFFKVAGGKVFLGNADSLLKRV
jgi:hypothetical protein